MNKNEGLANILNIIGYVVIGIGVIAGIVIMVKMSESGMFSQGGLTLGGFLAGVGVAFYHVVFGAISIGISRVLTDERFDRLAVENRRAPKGDGGAADMYCGECGAQMSGHNECPACGAKA
jgi:hypothetical protein